MATTRPGEIRCPTCHRSTPPAAFCTQCGAPIPSDLRVRPRGMDRDELQERIRARRVGGEPYRRGLPAGEEGPGYGRFEPEDTDAAARREEDPPGAPRIDQFDDATAPPPLTREPEPEQWPDANRWQQETPSASAEPAFPQPHAQEPAYEEPGYQADPHYEEAGPYADEYAAGDDDAAGYPYEYEAWDEGERRSSGASGAVAIIGFLALGVAALLGGAFLANVFGDGGTGALPSVSPSPSVAATVAPTVAPTSEATANETAEPDGSPSAGEGPVRFPDGVVFHVAACATSEMGFEGCAQDADTVSGGAVWAWMAFGLTLEPPPEPESARASGSDSLVLILRTADGTVIDQQPPRVLSEVPGIACPDTCSGYLFQGYSNLTPGDYELVLERNGEFADSDTFSVGG